MQKLWISFWMLILATTTVLAIPLFVQKRQSDQRIAELETLLALHKYGVGYGVGSHRLGGRKSPGYGLIDFNYIGRKKKSYGTGKSVGNENFRQGLTSPSWSSSAASDLVGSEVHRKMLLSESPRRFSTRET